MAPAQPLRILELYSGIGGMHMAAKESGVPFEIVGTYEINTTAVEVYQHNFPDNGKKSTKPRNIMGLTTDHLASLHPDLIMMSPPCQPFTRQGLKRDVEDARTSSLLHVLDLLSSVPHPPKMILLENVSGFETSIAREKLIGVLTQRNYIWQEFLLSPTQFGVPNSRLRYYILAKQKPASLPFTTSNKIEEEFPLCLCVKEASRGDDINRCSWCSKPSLPTIHHVMYKTHASHLQTASHHHAAHTQPPAPLGNNLRPDTNIESHSHCVEVLSRGHTQTPSHLYTTYTQLPSPLSNYLDSDTNVEPYLLSDKVLSKYHMILDIVDSGSQRSCCFTKGYAHYVEGTGSVVQHNTSISMSEIYSEVEKMEDESGKLELLRRLQLSYFTPSEVARLMYFPGWFSFPDTTTDRQRYRVLGNSINVLVVTCLLLTLIEG